MKDNTLTKEDKVMDTANNHIEECFSKVVEALEELHQSTGNGGWSEEREDMDGQILFYTGVKTNNGRFSIMEYDDDGELIEQ